MKKLSIFPFLWTIHVNLHRFYKKKRKKTENIGTLTKTEKMWSFQITFIDDLVRQGRTRKHLRTHTHTTGKRIKINKTVPASIFKQQQWRCNFIPIESNISSPICLFTTEPGPIYRLKKKKNNTFVKIFHSKW